MATTTGMPMGDDPCMHLDMGHNMMMSMTFHFGYCENVMFDGWKIRNVGSLIGSMIGIILMAGLYEGIKYLREFLHTRSSQHLIQSQISAKKGFNKASLLNVDHLLQTFLHCVQMILSYFLMLIFMTYNGWLCISVVIGAALGFFLFGWKKSVVVDVTEHCN